MVFFFLPFSAPYTFTIVASNKGPSNLLLLLFHLILRSATYTFFSITHHDYIKLSLALFFHPPDIANAASSPPFPLRVISLNFNIILYASLSCVCVCVCVFFWNFVTNAGYGLPCRFEVELSHLVGDKFWMGFFGLVARLQQYHDIYI